MEVIFIEVMYVVNILYESDDLILVIDEIEGC